jgi:murein DD-endopeptidase MepM/ murein hydrolase activator NlpD
MEQHLRDQYEIIFKLLYGLLRQPPQLPEGITPDEARLTVSQFAHTVILEEKLSKIPEPWDREKLLSVNLLLLDTYTANKETSIPVNLQELIEERRKFLEIEEKETTAKILRNPTVHQQVQASLNQLSQNLLSESPTLSQEISLLSESIAADFIDNPTEVVAMVGNLIEKSSQLSGQSITTEKLVDIIDPVLTPLVQSQVVFSNFYNSVNLELVSLPEETATKAARQALAVKVIYPEKSGNEIVQWLVLKTESSTRFQFPDSARVAESIDRFNFEAKGRELLFQTLTSQGLPAEIATRFTQDKIPETVRFLASYAPKSEQTLNDNDNTRNISVLRDLNYAAAYFLESRYHTPVLRYLERFNWQTVYQVYDQEIEIADPRQIYSTQTSNPFLNFIFDQGKGYFQDKATNLVLDKAATILGRTAATTATAEGAAAATTTAAAGTAATTAATTGTATSVFNPVLGLLVAAGTYLTIKLLPSIKRIFNDSLGTLVGGFLGIVGGFATAGFSGAVALGVGGAALGYVALPSGGAGMAVQSIGAKASQFFGGITTLAVTEIATPIIIILGSIPIVIALLLFIIQNSAHLVPPSYSSAFGVGGAPYTGPLPEGCPTQWPLDSSRITQGAWVSKTKNPGNYHSDTEALDMRAAPGTSVKATHAGVVINKHTAKGYGNYVDLLSTCTFDGKSINVISRYAHLSAHTAPDHSLVGAGVEIGLSGGSGGYEDSPHLHYEFRYDHSFFYKTHLEAGIAPYMWPNFIPKEVPRGCVMFDAYRDDCNTIIP